MFFAPFEHHAELEQTNLRIAERLRDRGVPVVLLDRDVSRYPERSDFDVVGLDNVLAGYLLAEHLAKLGCERLAFVSRPQSASSVNARIAGVRESLTQRGIEMRRDWLQVGDPTNKRFVRKLTAGNRWDACICANDESAEPTLMNTAASLKVSIPRRSAGCGL